MKKIVSILVLISMLVSALVFTSCNVNIGVDDGVRNFVDMIKGMLGIHTRYTITEEEWEQTINMTNFTISDIMGVISFKYAGLTSYASLLGQERMYVFQDGIEYELVKKNGKWYGGDTGEIWYTSRTFGELFFSEMFETKINFSDLVFNENANVYEYIDASYGDIVRFEFHDGVIYSMAMDSEKVLVKDVGKTVIKVPSFTIVENIEDYYEDIFE